MIYIHAIRILLQTSPTPNTAIGLYSGGEIRLSEIDLTDYSSTLPYTAGLLPVDFCDSISESIDVEESGNIARVDGTTIKILNTIEVSGVQTQFDKILSDSGIQLIGSTVQVIRFEISSGSLTDADGTVLFRGILGDPTWDEMTYVIPAENAYYTRRANLTQYVDSVLSADASPNTTGAVVPVTFGSHDYAKFVRVSDKVQYLNNLQVINYLTGVTPAGYDKVSLFPCRFNSNAPFFFVTTPVLYIYAFDTDYPNSLGSYAQNEMFFIVKEGKLAGEIRQVKAIFPWKFLPTDLTSGFQVEYNTYLKDALDGEENENQSWLTLLLSNRDYIGDTFRCFGPVNSTGGYVSSQSKLFTYENDTFSEIGNYAYDIDTTDVNNNKIKLNPQLCSGSVDDLASFKILPMTEAIKYSKSNLSAFGFTGYNKLYDGLFASGAAEITSELRFIETDFYNNMIDKNNDTKTVLDVSCIYKPAGNFTFRHYTTIDFKLPDIDDNFNFDSCYFLIKLRSSTTIKSGVTYTNVAKFHIFKRRFVYAPTKINDGLDVFSDNFEEDTYATLDNVPDFYYTDGTIPDTGNRNFYVISGDKKDTVGDDPYKLVNGYENFIIDGVTSVESYRALKYITLIFEKVGEVNSASAELDPFTDKLEIFETGIIFKQTKSVKSDFYVKFKGRIFNDSWPRFEPPYAVIESAPDIAEHVLRQQNFADNSNTPLIDTLSFDDESLSELRDIPLRTQILDYNNAYTDSVVESIAKQHFLAFTQNPATGDERVSLVIDRTTETPSLTINLTKIIPGSIRPVEPIRTRYIYAEPYIRYNKNFASGGYDSIIRITNAHQTTYSTDYVSGLTGDRAENLWNKAHVLWNAVKKIETPPASLTDHNWIYTQAGAYWYLDNWLTWMGAADTDTGFSFDPKRRIELSVPYEIGKDLKLMDWVLLQLPHQTNNEGLKSRVERYRKTIVKGRESVELRLIVYGLTNEVARTIQDVYSNDSVWQDVYTNTDIIQDTLIK